MRLARIFGMRARGLLFVLPLSGLTASPLTPRPTRQPSTVVITVVDAGTQQALTNADVTDLLSGQHRITDEQGQARIDWPADGQLKLRVRELGYKPIVRAIQRDDASRETASFAMSRVAYVVSDVKSKGRCVIDADSASRMASVSALEQLRQGAEKYAEFKKAYPFATTVERRTAEVPKTGTVRAVSARLEAYKSENMEARYRPGDIVKRLGGTGFSVPILFLSNLADTVFWENHCYIVRGIEWLQGARVVRLDFSPNTSVTGPDWQGSALLDSATSYLLRVNFSVANLGRRDLPRRLEGYTTFFSPSPFVIMPDSSVAQWWLDKNGDKDAWGQPDFIEGLYIQGLIYSKAKPPRYPNEELALPPPLPQPPRQEP